MDMDLTQALRDAAEHGTAHRHPLATGPLLQRIHRRRTARIAVESTVGVAAAGAVAVGAVQVTAMRGTGPAPVAPATASPTPTPAPTPSDPASPWAVVAADAPFECGRTAPRVVDPEGDGDVRFEVELLGAGDAGPGDLTLTAGEPLTVRPVLVNGSDRALDGQAGGSPQVWLVQDGTVVGTVDSGPSTEPVGEYALAPGAREALAVLGGTPVTCDPGSSTTGLPAGTYTVYVVQTFELGGGLAPLVASAPRTVSVSEPDGDGGTAPVPPDDDTGAHPDLAELVASPAGLGPLAVGVPPATNPGAAMIEWDPDYCDVEAGAGGEPGRWVPSGYPQDVVDGTPKQAFFVSADAESVQWIDILGPTIRTAEGVGVGTPLTDLQASYPALEGPFDGPVSRVWWLTGSAGILAFETQGDESGLQPAGTPEKVVIMRILEPGSDPRFAAANTGQVAGSCL